MERVQGLENGPASRCRYRGGIFARVGVLSALYCLQVELELCGRNCGACVLGRPVFAILSDMYSNNAWNKKEGVEGSAKNKGQNHHPLR